MAIGANSFMPVEEAIQKGNQDSKLFALGIFGNIYKIWELILLQIEFLIQKMNKIKIYQMLFFNLYLMD